MAATDKLIHTDGRFLPRQVSMCPLPTDTPTNASYALTYTAGVLTQIDMTIDGTTFRRTLSWTGSQLDTISAWSQV